MPKLERCWNCRVQFKHHELVAHRRTTHCGVDVPLKNIAIKAKAEFRQGTDLTGKSHGSYPSKCS